MDKKFILSLFKEIPFSKEMFSADTLNLKELLYVEEMQKPESSLYPEKITHKADIFFEDDWRKTKKNTGDNKQSENTDFHRSNNITNNANRENNHINQQGNKIINLEINNLNLSETPLGISPTEPFYYLKGQYPNFTGPFSAKQLEDMYKAGKLDSNFSFRPIDFFCFKGTPFLFKSIKVINNENWYENLVMNPIIKDEEYLKNFEADEE